MSRSSEFAAGFLHKTNDNPGADDPTNPWYDVPGSGGPSDLAFEKEWKMHHDG